MKEKWYQMRTSRPVAMHGQRFPRPVLLLDVFSHLYKRVCPSIRPSVHPSVRPSVRLSVRPTVRPSIRGP